MSFRNFTVPYAVDGRYSKKVAYFSMEFAVHQPLKIYSGGLGFLAGSHLRSAYELRQNMISIGILWKYGYYDQARNLDQTLQITWMEKQYSFLEDTGIKFQVNIHEHPVWVKAWYLNPETFKSAPLFLLSTDLPENDSRSGRFPRFADENLEQNVQLVRVVDELASTKGCTPGQLAIAWVLARGQDIVPIPGTKRRRYLEENLGAVDVELTADDIAWLDEHIGQPAGDRYADMRTVNR